LITEIEGYRAFPSLTAQKIASLSLGFRPKSHYAKSSQALGMTPTNFRNGGTGTTIRFAVAECSLGSVLVAASEKGVCAIFIGTIRMR